MNKQLKNAGFIVLMLLLGACSKKIVGEAPITTQDYQVATTANSIQVEAAMRLRLSNELPAGSVQVITHENIHKYIQVVSSGSNVAIELADNNNYKDISIEVWASAAQYSAIVASGASTISAATLPTNTTTYEVTLSGASQMHVDATAHVPTLQLTASGASTFAAPSLTTDALGVNLSGASEAEVGVNQSITGMLSGASTLIYWGEAVDQITLSGASEVRKINK